MQKTSQSISDASPFLPRLVFAVESLKAQKCENIFQQLALFLNTKNKGVAFVLTSLGVKHAELLIKDSDDKVLWRVPLTGRLDYLIPGDLDDDGHVGLADAILALQVVAVRNPQGIHRIVDVNSDGKIGLEEAIHALQHAAELRW